MPGPRGVIVPMKLDAFVFNEKVCSGSAKQAKIAPIVQPNYTWLRLKLNLAQNDILDHVDLFNSSPASRNPRFSDIGKALPRANRQGVYVHWVLPRPLRSGVAASDSATEKPKRASAPDSDEYPQNEGDDKGNGKPDATAPRYHALPNRWLVVRKLDPKARTTIPQNTNIEPLKAWIIESDRTRSVDEIPDSEDLQVDVAPFITSFLPEGASAGDLSVDQQAEIFIGQCYDLKDWQNSKTAEDNKLPPVGLSAASSSNQLFMDFQYHCSNVFSMLDTFAYTDPADKSIKHLTAAKASYYVVGWHSDASKDLMAVKNPANPKSVTVLYNDTNEGDAKKPNRRARIANLKMEIMDMIPSTDRKAISDWLDSSESARSLFHGTMYDVEWSAEKPKTMPSDVFGEAIASRNLPAAVGTTPINSILAYLGARRKLGSLEDSIWQLQALLRAEDNSVDAHVAAMDEVQHANYSTFDGGSQFATSGQTGGVAPDEKIREQYRTLNAAQKLKDAASRRAQQLRWDIFSDWWKYVSNIDNAAPSERSTFWTSDDDKEKTPQAKLKRLLSLLSKLERYIGNPDPTVKREVMELFHQRADPTLMFAGLETGWPVDFNNRLKVRFDNQLVTSNGQLEDDLLDPLPRDVSPMAKDLLAEFLNLESKSAVGDPKPTDAVLPLYHDGKNPEVEVSDSNPWRDRWGNTQPWFPLYFEWDAEYTHIPFDAWKLVERKPRESGQVAKKITYTLVKDVELPAAPQIIETAVQRDVRSVSGRSLILPQPSFSLKIHLQRLFDTVPETELDKYLPKGKREELFHNLDKLAFLSVPLDGLTDHLRTLVRGSHIKPLVRVPGREPVVIKEAEDFGTKIGLAKGEMALIDKESGATPYGSVGSLVGQKINAFKSVTHGQLRFTKLNIIDKFGQVVHAIDPSQEQIPAVYPTVSEEFAIDESPKDAGQPNVVDRSRSTLDHSEFIQLTPSINQPARVNAHFVVHGNEARGEYYWRPASQWDEPIWGWVILNYVDNGLQFFLADGTFYREARISSGTSNDLEWVPFEPPTNQKAPEQLRYLLEKLSDPKTGQAYVRALVDLIAGALSSTTPPPSAYAQFMNSLVGKPLALAHMGWSLELDTKSWANQSTVEDQVGAPKPEYGLLEGDGEKRYQFKIKFGDKSRNYDGLVGYYKTRHPSERNAGDPQAPRENEDSLLEELFTYPFGRKPLDGQPLREIVNSEYPSLTPFWLDPIAYTPKTVELMNADDDDGKAALEQAAKRFEYDRNKELMVYTALFDPFAPICGFTSILPIRTLKLPSWTWESALRKMTTFFHAGPLLLTGSDDKKAPEPVQTPSARLVPIPPPPATAMTNTPLPPFDPKAALTSEYNLKKPDSSTGKVALPSLNTADWAWLQPYDMKSTDPSNATRFMAVEIDGSLVNERPKWKPGPMTAVEGFMQLRAPIEQEKPKPPTT